MAGDSEVEARLSGLRADLEEMSIFAKRFPSDLDWRTGVYRCAFEANGDPSLTTGQIQALSKVYALFDIAGIKLTELAETH